MSPKMSDKKREQTKKNKKREIQKPTKTKPSSKKLTKTRKQKPKESKQPTKTKSKQLAKTEPKTNKTKKTQEQTTSKKQKKDYLKNFLREAVSLAVGRNSDDIADLLYNKKHVNEFLLAKKLNLTINQTRNILYKIADYGLVSSIRKKDKKKGWYTYFWRVNIIRSLEFLKEILLKHINNLKNQIKSREEKQFYECKNCKIEFNEENSLFYDFSCPECGRILSLKNNTKILREYKKRLKMLENEVFLINEELKKAHEKEEKQRLRDHKKDTQQKAEKRKAAAKKARKTIKERKQKRSSKTNKKGTKKKKEIKPKKREIQKPTKTKPSSKKLTKTRKQRPIKSKQPTKTKSKTNKKKKSRSKK